MQSSELGREEAESILDSPSSRHQEVLGKRIEEEREKAKKGALQGRGDGSMHCVLMFSRKMEPAGLGEGERGR